MEQDLLKEKCLEALKSATTITEFAKLIGYRSGGLHERTLTRLSNICGRNIREVIASNKENSIPERTCKFCGKIFKHKYSKYSSGDFCSLTCAKKFSAKTANTPELIQRKRQIMLNKPPGSLVELKNTPEFQRKWREGLNKRYPKKVWVCPICGKELLLTESQIKKRKYCSGTCRNIATNKYKNGSVSRAEKMLKEYLISNFPELDVLYNDRKILDGLELDAYIPSLKYAVEWNGIFHYKNIQDKLADIQAKDALKVKLCESKGIFLRVIKDLKSDNKTIKDGILLVKEDLENMGV